MSRPALRWQAVLAIALGLTTVAAAGTVLAVRPPAPAMSAQLRTAPPPLLRPTTGLPGTTPPGPAPSAVAEAVRAATTRSVTAPPCPPTRAPTGDDGEQGCPQSPAVRRPGPP